MHISPELYQTISNSLIGEINTNVRIIHAHMGTKKTIKVHVIFDRQPTDDDVECCEIIEVNLGASIGITSDVENIWVEGKYSDLPFGKMKIHGSVFFARKEY